MLTQSILLQFWDLWSSSPVLQDFLSFLKFQMHSWSKKGGIKNNLFFVKAYKFYTINPFFLVILLYLKSFGFWLGSWNKHTLFMIMMYEWRNKYPWKLVIYWCSTRTLRFSDRIQLSAAHPWQMIHLAMELLLSI